MSSLCGLESFRNPKFYGRSLPLSCYGIEFKSVRKVYITFACFIFKREKKIVLFFLSLWLLKSITFFVHNRSISKHEQSNLSGRISIHLRSYDLTYHSLSCESTQYLRCDAIVLLIIFACCRIYVNAFQTMWAFKRWIFSHITAKYSATVMVELNCLIHHRINISVVQLLSFFFPILTFDRCVSLQVDRFIRITIVLKAGKSLICFRFKNTQIPF